MTRDKNRVRHLISDYGSDHQACIRKVERLSHCIEIANLINSELSIGKLLSNVMETTKKTFAADAASMLLIDEETGDLTFQIALGDVGDELKEMYRIKKGLGIAGMVAQTGEPVNIEDVYLHPQFSDAYDRQTHYRTRSMLCVPLKVRGKIIGVIEVINKQTEPFVFTNEELEMMVMISSSAAIAVDTAQMHRVILQRETLERDLRLAREVQESFLPREMPVLDAYRFSAANQPALEVGGDFYHFFNLPSNQLGIVLGDVSGKGISASLFMAKLSSDLLYYTLLYPEPKDLLGQVNRVLCQRAKRGMFVTLVYLLLDTVQHCVRIANAGHLSPICSDGEKTGFLGSNDCKGPPLGILPDIEFEQETFELDPDTRIALYTDGVTEAKNDAGELFGIQRLMEVVKTSPHDPGIILNTIIRAVDGFTSTAGRSDDLTLLVMSRDKNGINPIAS